MKKMLAAAMLMVFAMAGTSWSQNAPPASAGMNGAQAGGPAPAMGKPMDSANFQTRKAEILEHMNKRLADMQQRINCVKAAQDPQAMHACMPPRREGGPNKNGQQGTGPQNQAPMMPQQQNQAPPAQSK